MLEVVLVHGTVVTGHVGAGLGKGAGVGETLRSETVVIGHVAGVARGGAGERLIDSRGDSPTRAQGSNAVTALKCSTTEEGLHTFFAGGGSW